MNVRKQVVNGIKKSLRSSDRVALVEKYIADGCSYPELFEAINRTKYRFRLYRSGLSIEIVAKRELRLELDAAIILLKEMSEKLVAHDKFGVPFSKQIQQIRVRTEVARQAHAVERAKRRLNEFLLPKEQFYFGKRGLVNKLLRPVGFKWGGGGDVVSEISTEEHPATDDDHIERMFAQWDNPQQIRWAPASMSISSIEQLLTALRVAAASDDGECFAVALEQARMGGAPLVEIARALERSLWRYEISHSGANTRWEDLVELDGLMSEIFSDVKNGVSALVANERGGGQGFRSLNVRETLGKSCFKLWAEGDRVFRYLFPHETSGDVSESIAYALEGSGFAWDGGYEVERYPGENAKLLQDAIAFHHEQGAGPG